MEYWLSADSEAALGELMEALGLASGGVLEPGVSFVYWPPGTAYEKFPPDETYNAGHWGNVLSTRAEAARDVKPIVEKPSSNGNPPSKWEEWTLASGVGYVFYENGNGGLAPIKPRMVWAV